MFASADFETNSKVHKPSVIATVYVKLHILGKLAHRLLTIDKRLAIVANDQYKDSNSGCIVHIVVYHYMLLLWKSTVSRRNNWNYNSLIKRWLIEMIIQ